MTPALIGLSTNDIQTLISAISSGRLAAPFSELQLSRVLPKPLCHYVATDLQALSTKGFTPNQIADVLCLIRDDRNSRDAREPAIDLVTSGPEADGVSNRDTAVVVDEMFKHAENSVLVVGYAVYQGQKVFESLANRMAERPDLDVVFFLDIPRNKGEDTKQEIVVSRYVTRFKEKQWPAGKRLPSVFYDPRSSADVEVIRSSLHAKCIIVDRKQVFVSSANFTEAGQQRNIEVGLRIDSPWLAERLARHFEMLREKQLVQKAV
ncbi:MAG: DISARM system phospholipase D-like protein DrmC [bacterium]|nr:DISARM system phospholipase D-like protein DrmC [bacterium]